MRSGIPLGPEQSQFALRISQLRDELRADDPGAIAKQSGATIRSNDPMQIELQLDIWGQPAVLPFPELVGHDLQTGEELPLTLQALLLYYLKTADGTPPFGHWVSFSELPGGKFYNAAYQGYTGKELGRLFQNDLDGFVRTALNLGGALQPASLPALPGDRACSFAALPRVSMLVAAWAGDEDFPSSFQILFDASASHYLPTDVCAVLGSMLTHKLISAYRSHPLQSA